MRALVAGRPDPTLRVKLLTVVAGSRTGKSRFARELRNALRQITDPNDPLHGAEVYILEFKDEGDGPTMYDKQLGASVFLGIRLAAKYIFKCHMATLLNEATGVPHFLECLSLATVSYLLRLQDQAVLSKPRAQLIVLDDMAILRSEASAAGMPDLASMCALELGSWVQAEAEGNVVGLGMLMGTGLAGVYLGFDQAQLASTMGLPGFVDWLRAALLSDPVLELLAQEALLTPGGTNQVAEEVARNMRAKALKWFWVHQVADAVVGPAVLCNMLLLSLLGLLMTDISEVGGGRSVEDVMSMSGKLWTHPVESDEPFRWPRMSAFIPPHLQQLMVQYLLNQKDLSWVRPDTRCRS
ncbi:hypothetical protein WJX72_005335 [[Myrmecia] bisecta]|uniref:Uncharacterized protein n=1 Tax=[Myrmecia] bisecta TaxID=41462 RepID=A0AAW1Q8X5_9CHLO